METKVKDALKTKDALRLLQADVKQLQSAVAALQGIAQTSAPDEDKAGKGDWSVHFAVKDPAAKGSGAKGGGFSLSDAQLSRVSDDAAAMLGGAVSSPQKIALLRSLLASENGEAAAALGEAASLSTGSLYHHLHDLSHAGLIAQAGRNRYTLTERGRRVLLVFLALVAHA